MAGADGGGVSAPIKSGLCSGAICMGVALIGRFDDPWTLFVGSALIGLGLGVYPWVVQ